MDDPKEDKLKQEILVRMPCSSCGSEMVYSAAKGLMYCESCTNTCEVPTSKDRIIERNFTEALNLDDQPTGLGIETKSFSCKNCGAVEMVPPDQPILVCSFCASNNVNPTAYDTKVIQPAGILPFVIENKKAIEIFREWIGNGWFHPNALKKVKDVSKIEGIYIPFWTYDADTDSSWTAESGYYYYETVYYEDQNGNQQTRQERRVRWVWSEGFYQHFFDDVLVVGSKGVSQNTVEDIFPFQLDKVVNYDSKFMLGWKAEVYGVDAKAGYSRAEKIMQDYIYSQCASMIPGDTFRNLDVHTKTYGITFKHILLPIWIAAYQFNGESYQVVLNGTTGKITGQKPLSFFKIAIAVILVLVIAFIAYKLSK